MYEILLTILMANSAPNAIPAPALAKEIMTVAAKNGTSPVLIAQIIMTESNGNPNAFNAASKDHGLMQINERTAKAMKLTSTCLYNWKCNLAAGAKIVSKLKRPCAYNVGNAGSQKATRAKKCLYYEEKLAKVLLNVTDKTIIAKED